MPRPYAFYNEHDRQAAAWLRELIKQGVITDGTVDERSIEDVVPAELAEFDRCHFFAGIGVWDYALNQAGWPDDRRVWTGSCPCQPFSAAGKKEAFADERHLWPFWSRLIYEGRPEVVIGEQVSSSEVVGTQLEASFVIAVREGQFAKANKIAKQLVQSKSFHYWARWLDVVHGEMEGAGYTFRPEVLGAHSAGAPHIRQRLYFVADATNGGRQSISVRKSRSNRKRVESSESRLQSGVIGSDVVPLAISNSGNTGTERLQRSGEHGQQSQDGRSGELGDSGGSGLQGCEQRASCDGDGHGPDAHGPVGESGCSSCGVTLGDAATEGLSERSSKTLHGRQARGFDKRSGDASSLYMPDGMRLREPGSESGTGEQSLPDSQFQSLSGDGMSGTLPAPTNGFWRDAEWVYCRDEKYRPVEPGTFPLVTGAPARVGRLRGYGNSIVAPLAIAWIESYLDLIEEKH